MKHYKEFQIAWLIFGISIPIQIFLTYLYINDIGNNPMSTGGFLAINVLFVIIYLLFYGLKTIVGDNQITLSFGMGLIKKKIQVNQIANTAVVRNPWYYGWGIRIIPNGTMYNIDGFEAVELKFKDTSKIFRIGTKKPHELRGAINNILKSLT